MKGSLIGYLGCLPSTLHDSFSKSFSSPQNSSCCYLCLFSIPATRDYQLVCSPTSRTTRSLTELAMDGQELRREKKEMRHEHGLSQQTTGANTVVRGANLTPHVKKNQLDNAAKRCLLILVSCAVFPSPLTRLR